MNAIRAAALFAAFAIAPFGAATADAFTVSSPVAMQAAPQPVAFLRSGALAPGRQGQIERDAARRYFDFDALVTFGALALAGGAMAALGAARARARARAKPPVGATHGDGEWHASVFQALQADLTEFTRPYRRAA